MHLGDGRGFLCDGCGIPMKYHEKYEIAFKRYTYDETLPIVKSMKFSTICAYDFCDECFEKAYRRLNALNKIRPEHNPKQILNQRYFKLVRQMKNALKNREEENSRAKEGEVK